MNARGLKILLVAEDRSLLGPLSKFLTLVGYNVSQTTDARRAIAIVEAERPDFLIVDGDLDELGGRELCRDVAAHERHNHIFTLLLVERPHPREMIEALKQGVDDFLVKPIVFGELLARLRAAARVLEYERRVESQGGVDPVSFLMNGAAFREQLAQALEADARQRTSTACVLVDLDFFKRINHNHGYPTGNRVLAEVAALLAAEAGDEAVVACLGGNRFAVLHAGLSEELAAEWAERTRRAIAGYPLPIGEGTERLTASFGVAAATGGEFSADELLERAGEALEAAKRSGRDGVVCRIDLDDESNAWTNLAAPGKLFERTLARDVMTPCSVTLRPDDTLAHAATLLERSKLTGIPVVDEAGKPVGLLMAENATLAKGEAARGSRLVRDVLTMDPARFEESTSFAALMDFFTHDSRPLVLIVDHGLPTGLVTRQGLAALSEPLTGRSFAPAGGFTATSDYLVVPEACTCE